MVQLCSSPQVSASRTSCHSYNICLRGSMKTHRLPERFFLCGVYAASNAWNGYVLGLTSFPPHKASAKLFVCGSIYHEPPHRKLKFCHCTFRLKYTCKDATHKTSSMSKY